MAAYLKFWLFEPPMYLLGKSGTISLLRKTNLCQSINFTRYAQVLKIHESGDVSVLDKDDKPSVENDKTSHVQVDPLFLEELYRKEREKDLRNISKGTFSSLNKTEYFKEAWQNKFKKTENKFSRSLSQTIEEQTDDSSANTFGTLFAQQRTESKVSSVTDLRDVNERLAEEYPDDKDKERSWRQNIPLTRYGRLGRKAFYYTKKMTKLGREGKINEAMQVFDDWMMVQDRVMPSKRTFITLIGIVGRVGYTRKAFQLFRQMKHLGLDPPSQVYTSLFNACANCPMPDYGLKRAYALYDQIQVKDISLNPITAMAAMKAFALCGDFPKAFQILDETRVPLDSQCFNSLLMACAMDKESGFRRALKVWQMMREHNIQPEYQTFNLLIRCIRDCGVGDVKTLAADFGLEQGESDISPVNFFRTTENDNILLTSGKEKYEKQDMGITFHNDESNMENLKESEADVSKLQFMQQLSETPSRLDISKSDQINIVNEDNTNGSLISYKSYEKEWWEDSDSSLQFDDWKWEKSDKTDSGLFVQNILDSDHSTGITVLPGRTMNPVTPPVKSVSLSDMNTKTGRLALIGGVSSFVSHMMHHVIKPDIKTFTELLSCVPNDAVSEVMIMTMMKDMDVAPDIDFLNDIMMRRNMRHESHSVEEVIVLVSKFRLTPNMRTYASIALTCHRWPQAQDLLEDMKAANVEPTVEVMGHLIYISRLDFLYKRHLLEKMQDLAVKPGPRIISMIEKSIAIAKRHIVMAEKNPDQPSFYCSPKFQRRFSAFLRFYQSWLLRTNVDKEEHPWTRFTDSGAKKDVEENIEKSVS